MQALQLIAPGRMALAEMPVPAPPAGFVLVRTGAAVICTSDINDLRSNPFQIALPVVMGHEGAGRVAACGEGVTGFAPGQAVAAHPVHPCLNCAHCHAGLGHLCPNMRHFALNLPGVFADYFLARADRLRDAEGLAMPVAALAEPVCVCLEALAQARLSAGSRLLILGDGPFGVMIARLAAKRDPTAAVVLAGHHDYRLGFAAKAMAVNTHTAPPERLAELGGDLGYDAAILAVGSAAVVRQAQALLRPGGRLVVFSAVAGLSEVDLFDLHVREIELVGACNDRDRFDAAMAHLRTDAGMFADLVTHRIAFGAMEGIERAFELAGGPDRRAMKVAFEFDRSRDA